MESFSGAVTSEETEKTTRANWPVIVSIIAAIVFLGLILFAFAVYSWHGLFGIKEYLYEEPTISQIETIKEYCLPSMSLGDDIVVDSIITSSSPHKSDSFIALLMEYRSSEFWHGAVTYLEPRVKRLNQIPFTYDAEKYFETCIWAYRLLDEDKVLLVVSNVSGDIIAQIEELSGTSK